MRRPHGDPGLPRKTWRTRVHHRKVLHACHSERQARCAVTTSRTVLGTCGVGGDSRRERRRPAPSRGPRRAKSQPPRAAVRGRPGRWRCRARCALPASLAPCLSSPQGSAGAGTATDGPGAVAAGRDHQFGVCVREGRDSRLPLRRAGAAAQRPAAGAQAEPGVGGGIALGRGDPAPTPADQPARGVAGEEGGRLLGSGRRPRFARDAGWSRRGSCCAGTACPRRCGSPSAGADGGDEEAVGPPHHQPDHRAPCVRWWKASTKLVRGRRPP